MPVGLFSIGGNMILYVVLFFVGLAVSLVLWIYYSIHYRRVKQDVYNEKNVDAATRKEVDRLRARDPMISCDFCGAKIDTRKFLNCPQCGAVYKKDLEWKYRRNADNTRVGKLSGSEYGYLEEKLWKKDPRLKSLRRKIFLSSLPLIFAAVLCIYAFLAETVLDYRRDDSLNQGDSHYISTGYTVKGDPVIYDDGDLAITITGFYFDESILSLQREEGEWNGNVKVGMRITNRTDQKLSLEMESDSYNGVTIPHEGFTVYDRFRKNRDTQIYVYYFGVPKEALYEMVITELTVKDKNGKLLHSLEKPLVVTTTAAVPESVVKLEGETPVFTNDRVDIFRRYEDRKEEPGYYLYIVNKAGCLLNVENETRPSGDNPYLFFYRADLPEGYTLVGYMDRSRMNLAGLDPEISLMIRDPEDTSKSFSTGKFRVN